MCPGVPEDAGTYGSESVAQDEKMLAKMIKYRINLFMPNFFKVN